MTLSCCGAPWPDDDQPHYCALGTRRVRYERPHVELKPARVTWTCACRRPDGRPLLRAHRHANPWECLPQVVVDAWAKRVGCSPTIARELFFLELHFGRADAPHT